MIKNYKEVNELVGNEKNRGIEEYGHNHSRHEGYAVMREELDEFEVEYEKIKSDTKVLWNMTKNNEKSNIVSRQLDDMSRRAKLMICEAIQFAAMLDKMYDFEQNSCAKNKNE